MPAPLFLGNCNYTPFSTNGTQTVNQGGGVFYGGIFIQNGTSFTYTAYDIYTAGTTTTTSQLTATQTGSGAGQLIQPTPAGIGLRYRGSLVIITTGTAGVANTLWD